VAEEIRSRILANKDAVIAVEGEAAATSDDE